MGVERYCLYCKTVNRVTTIVSVHISLKVLFCLIQIACDTKIPLICISGFQKPAFVDSVQSTVKPLVVNIRSIMFSTTYLLLVWAAAMLLCQITARVIFCYLKTSTHLKRTKIYQLPSQCTDGPDRTLYTEEKFENHSVIAESCESGVYDLTN